MVLRPSRSCPASLEGFKLDLLIVFFVDGAHRACSRSSWRCCAPRGPPALAPFRILATVYVDLFRGMPLLLVLYLIGFGVPALRLPGLPDARRCAGHRRDRAHLLRLRRRGHPLRHPVGAPEPARRRPLARPLAGPDACATSCCRRPSAAWCRRCSTTSSRCSRTSASSRSSASSRPSAAAQIETARDFNYTPYVVAGDPLPHPHDPAHPVHRPPARKQGSHGVRTRVRDAHERCSRLERRARKSFGSNESCCATSTSTVDPGTVSSCSSAPSRLRQVDPAALHQPARAHRRRPHRSSTASTSPTRASTPTTSARGSASCSSRSTCSRT